MKGTAAFRSLQIGTRNTNGVESGATTGTGAPVDCSDYSNLSVAMTASAILSAGTLIAEEADYSDANGMFTGTWSQIASYTLSSVFTASGQSIQHLPQARYPHVRLRVGTTVVGGTLLATLLGGD